MAFHDEPRLPGELPPHALRSLHRYTQAHHVSAERSLCTSSADGYAEEVVGYGGQENQVLEEDDGDLLQVVKKLDNIIARLLASCKENPKISECKDAGVASTAEELFNVQDMEDRLDKLIQKISQGGQYLSRCSKEFYSTPRKEDVQPLSSLRISSSAGNVKPPRSVQTEDETHSERTTPVSSFKLPLLTPRSLFSKFGLSEKVDSLDSPSIIRRQSSGGRSRRFSAAFSFLSSPRKPGTVLSFKSGSPKPADDYLER